MNRTLIFCILLLLFTDVQGARIILDRIAVVVDEDVITYSEVEERIRSVKSQFSGNEDGGLPPDDGVAYAEIRIGLKPEPTIALCLRLRHA